MPLVVGRPHDLRRSVLGIIVLVRHALPRRVREAERGVSKHLLDKRGDHCRYPHWEGFRLAPCGKRGYPFCAYHAAKVLDRQVERRRDPSERTDQWALADRVTR